MPAAGVVSLDAELSAAGTGPALHGGSVLRQPPDKAAPSAATNVQDGLGGDPLQATLQSTAAGPSGLPLPAGCFILELPTIRGQISAPPSTQWINRAELRPILGS